MAGEKRKKKVTRLTQRADDLSRIKGIGPARQRWLNEVLGVYTFADLANLSVDAVHTELKTGQVVSRSDIAEWLEQAKQLASVQKRQRAPENGWHPVASFVVEYQKNKRTGAMRTAIHHMEADKTQEWPGVEYNEVCFWMVQQLGEIPAENPVQIPEVETPWGEEIHQIMAQADALLGAQTPPQSVAVPNPQPTTSTRSGATAFSEELLRVMAQANAAQQAVSYRATPVQAAAPEKPAEAATTGFSETLQQKIAKARQLTAGKGRDR